MKRVLLCSLVLALPMACAPENEPRSAKVSTAKPVPEEAAAHGLSQFDDRLLEVARIYESFGRFDREARWAPTRCAPIRIPSPPEFCLSASQESGTHGRKMYSLFVKETAAYASQPNPVGQIIVK